MDETLLPERRRGEKPDNSFVFRILAAKYSDRLRVCPVKTSSEAVFTLTRFTIPRLLSCGRFGHPSWT
jgi:hypothetical protein